MFMHIIVYRETYNVLLLTQEVRVYDISLENIIRIVDSLRSNFRIFLMETITLQLENTSFFNNFGNNFVFLLMLKNLIKKNLIIIYF